jgi:hypothetical protein
MIRSVLMIGLAAIMMASGCNRPKPPPPPPATQAAAPEPVRPTTQQLLTGTYHKIPLPGMPLVVDVPQGWTIDTAAGLTFLQGPTPSGTATIQLAVRDPYSPVQLEMIVQRGKEEATAQPAAIKRFELQDWAKIKVLERLEFSNPVTSPMLGADGHGMVDAQGNLQTFTFTPVRWTWTVLVPNDKGFARYELNFIDLTAEQFSADRELLEKIIRSLTLAGPAPSITGGLP